MCWKASEEQGAGIYGGKLPDPPFFERILLEGWETTLVWAHREKVFWNRMVDALIYWQEVPRRITL
jgi:hypothetical protein